MFQDVHTHQQKLIKTLEIQLAMEPRTQEDLDVSETKGMALVDSSKSEFSEAFNSSLRNEIEDIKLRLEALKNKTKDNILKSSDVVFGKPIKIIGGLEVLGSLSINNMTVEQLNGHRVDDVLANTLRLVKIITVIKRRCKLP